MDPIDEGWKLDMLRKLWEGEEADPEKDGAEEKPRVKKTPRVKGKPWPHVDLHKFTELSKQLMEAEKAIEKALSGGHHGLIIIHGKGRGILRSELIKALQQHPAIGEVKDRVDADGKSGVLSVRFS